MNYSNFTILYFVWLIITWYLTFSIIKYVIGLILKKIILRKTPSLETRLMRIINSIFSLPSILSLSLALTIIISAIYSKYITIILFVLFGIFFIYFFRFSFNLADFFVDQYLQRIRDEDKKVKATLLKFFLKIAKVVVIIVILILVAHEFGLNINTLLAGLGLGGIIIAFGMQNILEDIFASFSIYFDRPFRLGDYIDIGKDSGTVTQIGFKTTRLKTQLGDELVVSNKDLVNSRIHNFGKLRERRVEFKLYVSFDTDDENLGKIKSIIEKIIENKKETRFGRVNLREILTYGLLYEIVFNITNSSYQEYMEIMEYINIEILKEFKKEKIMLVKTFKGMNYLSEEIEKE
jgi:small-conductance mechanosensitive channel